MQSHGTVEHFQSFDVHVSSSYECTSGDVGIILDGFIPLAQVSSVDGP
jgi:hypothetical protein